MARLSSVPFEKVDPELQAVMHEYDVELGGSGFVQVFAHTPEVFKAFINFYFPLDQHHARIYRHEIDGAGAP